MNLLDIVNGFEDAPSSNAYPKMLKDFQRHVKKIMSIIGLNLADFKNCKEHAEARKILCNIYNTKKLSNILYVRRTFFTCKMQKDDDLLDHVNKVKAFAGPFTCLQAHERQRHCHKFITLLENLLASYEYLIIVYNLQWTT